MPNFSYNLNIPDGPNDPSVDQPNMKTNTNSIASIIAVDHYGFGDNFGGLHKQVQLVALSAIPAGLISGTGTLYDKVPASPPGQENSIFFTPGNSGKEYQLTRTSTAFYSVFGTLTNYAPIVANQIGGYTFLPGGVLMQYGQMLSTGADTVVVFPFAYNTLYSLSSIRSQSSSTSYGASAVSASGFTFHADSSSVGIRFYWTALGI